jgi:dolichol kinase
MTDVGWLFVWLFVLCLGIGGCILLAHLGVATTYVRDVLHIGTGVWVLGWPLWHRGVAPVSLTLAAVVAISLVPALARSSGWVRHFQHSVSNDSERFGGLVLYTVAYAGLTLSAFTLGPFPAAAGLLALSLGDGVGGAVGRRFGRYRFQVPGAKAKSVEGSLTVLVFAGLGVLIAALRFGLEISFLDVAGLSVGAAAAEAVAPRGSDNILVPALVWGLAELLV